MATTAYMDRHYGMGPSLSKLIPGYDCPYHATYLDSDFTTDLKATTMKKSICVFETDIGTPITRHYEPTTAENKGGYLQATKGSKLVVRQIATVGNYDYLWDYVSTRQCDTTPFRNDLTADIRTSGLLR